MILLPYRRKFYENDKYIIKFIKENSIMDNNENNILYLDCDCRSEILRIEKDEEFHEYYMSIYRNGHRAGLLYRLKLIWQIITTGEPYVDDICLNQEEIDKMIEFLYKMKNNNNTTKADING
jgi:hypothetical protein